MTTMNNTIKCEYPQCEVYIRGGENICSRHKTYQKTMVSPKKYDKEEPIRVESEAMVYAR